MNCEYYIKAYFIKKIFIILFCILFSPYTFATNCPSEDIEKFFQLYSENVEIQKEFTHFPLEYYNIAQNDPEQTIRKVVIKAKDEARFPIIQSRSDTNRFVLPIDVRIEQNGNNAIVKITVIGQEHLVTKYFFTKDSCWKLMRIENLSK